MTTDPLDGSLASQLLAFVERTSDLVGVVDEESRVVYLNEAARKRLGVGDSTGLTTADLFPPHVVHAVLRRDPTRVVARTAPGTASSPCSLGRAKPYRWR